MFLFLFVSVKFNDFEKIDIKDNGDKRLYPVLPVEEVELLTVHQLKDLQKK